MRHRRLLCTLLARSKAYDRVAGFLPPGVSRSRREASASSSLAAGAYPSDRRRQLKEDDVAAIEHGEDLARFLEERLSSGELWDDLDEVRSYRLHLLA